MQEAKHSNKNQSYTHTVKSYRFSEAICKDAIQISIRTARTEGQINFIPAKLLTSKGASCRKGKLQLSGSLIFEVSQIKSTIIHWDFKQLTGYFLSIETLTTSIWQVCMQSTAGLGLSE